MNSKTALKGMKVARTPEKRREYAEKYKEAKVVERIKGCINCFTTDNGGTPIPLSGPVANEVKFVSYAPDGWDARRGQPLAGRGGSLFREKAIESGWGMAEASIMYQGCCHETEISRAESVAKCQGNYELQLGDSWLVVLIGERAFNTEFPRKQHSTNVGQFIWAKERLWYVLDDLDYYLNHPEMLASSLIALKRLYEGKQLPIKNPKTFMVSGRDIAKKLKNNKGWVHIWSNTIEAPIIVLKDAYASAPGKYSDLPHYTLSEIVRLKGVGKTGWKAVNLVKEQLGGTVYR